MAHTLCAESSYVALELHALLRCVDPARRWRSDLERTARARLDAIQKRLAGILEGQAVPSEDKRLARLYDRLTALAAHLERYRPRARRSAELQTQWREFQRRLQPAYAGLASCLARLAIPMPALRPTNYGRNAFHFACGLLCLGLVHFVLSPTQMMGAAVGFALFCWTMETLRVRFHGVTRFYMWFMGRIAHPHEHHRVNSATWFGTALAVLALGFSPLVCSVAVAVLCVGDPAAAVIGRRFGRIELRGGRTLEGTLGFVGSSVVASVVVLQIWYPELGLVVSGLVALAASVCGALAELVSGRIDDNLTIPVAAAAGAALVLMAAGL